MSRIGKKPVIIPANVTVDIAEGNTAEKREEIARNELGLVTPNEYVFYDVSN